MSGQRYTPEFKDEAVRQVVERGYSVGEVAERIGVSKHSLYKWVNAVKPNGDEKQAEEPAQAKREILKLRGDMRRLENERRAGFREVLEKIIAEVEEENRSKRQ